MAPSRPAGSSSPAWSRIRTSQPGTGLVAEPGLTSIGSRARGVAAVGGAGVGCHQGGRCGVAGVWGGGPAGLALPPVADARRAELLVRPVVGLRVEPLAGQEQGLERLEVV